MVKEFPADVQTLSPPDFTRIGEIEACRAPRQNARKGLLLRPDPLPLVEGQVRAAGREPPCPHRFFLKVDGYQFPGILHGKHLQPDGIYKFEDGCVRADTERQREYRDDREPG